MQIASLFPSSKFLGIQKSERNSYRVAVDIQFVDVERSVLSGYLTIHDLTKDYPVLTTFFDAEIVGDTYSFLTRKWDADEKIDREHWGKFPAFKEYASRFNTDGFREDWNKADHIFMRWKEHFLVPDHQVKSIDGASYEGFYYICYQKSTGKMCGYYYHRSSEKYQSLELEHVLQCSFPTFSLR